MDISCIAQKEVILQLVQNIFFNAQGVDHHVIAPVKFDKINPAKSRRILILVAAGNL